MTQLDQGNRFRALHQGPDLFLMPNPWDVGSARLLQGLGFPALATSSAAAAAVLGRRDGALSREDTLAQARELAEACEVPLSADLGRGFGDSPEVVAETIRLAAEAGLVGASIEDATGDARHPFYDLELAVERVRAAAEAARELPFPFTLTARAETFLGPEPKLDDAIVRLRAYERAGADVLFAPGLPDLAAVRAVCAAVGRPVSFMVGIPGKSFSVPELRAAGVRRVSFSSALYRAAMSALLQAAGEALDGGTFEFVESIRPTAELLGITSRGAGGRAISTS